MFSPFAREIRFVLLFGFFTAILVGAVTFLFPFYYSADSQVLIFAAQAGVDPYTQAKSAERIGENLAEVIRTTDFYDRVDRTNDINFNRGFFRGMDERTRRREWARDVKGTVQYGTSLMSIRVYARNRADVLLLSQAITETLQRSAPDYVGPNVTIKLVNAPLASRIPARPNILLNIVLGFIAGFVGAIAMLLRERKLWI